MLERIDFDVTPVTKEEYKEEHDALIERLVVLQQQARQKNVGLVVLFEGWNGAGRGGRISDLLYNLDARATSVHVTHKFDHKEAKRFLKEKHGAYSMYPFMQEFWQGLDIRGNMTIYERGWYDQAARMLFYASSHDVFDKHGNVKPRVEESMNHLVKTYKAFEQQLADDGYVVVKFFLNIRKETQAKRLKALANNPSTAWRVEKNDLKLMSSYDQYKIIFDRMLELTNFKDSQWVVINAEDRRRANLAIARTLVDALDQAINKSEDPDDVAAKAKAQANSAGAAEEAVSDERTRTPEEQAAVRERNEAASALQSSFAPKESAYPIEPMYPTLKGVDYHLRFDPEAYRRELKKEQKKLYDMELLMYLHRIPMIIMYEGQDAAGKGGSIKRVAQALDARSYNIFPSPAPTKPELLHPHLWRYWTRLPKAGHVGIYDRSWYGRVLVERVEGFASPKEWARAYDEINAFESDLIDWGAILLKFWVEIDRDEQLKRFIAREENPAKSWKIVDEDWRNRDKYPQYRNAVEDMFRLTSTVKAPWIILESNDKHYARIKALRAINDALETRLKDMGVL